MSGVPTSMYWLLPPPVALPQFAPAPLVSGGGLPFPAPGPPPIPKFPEPATAPANDSHTSKQMMRELQNSLLFRYNWPALVSAAPICMSKLGACCLTAYSANATITLEVGLRSGLKYDTLKANIAAVSNVGCEAFQAAEEKMSMVSDTSLALWNTVGMMGEHIGTLPDPDALKLLHAEFDTFVEGTKRCDELTQEIQTAFKSWGALVQQLREVIIHTQEKGGEAIWKPERGLILYTPPIASTPAAPVSSPVLPELDRPPVELVTSMIQAPHDDVLWELLPSVEMVLRRCYMVLTLEETDGGLDKRYAASTEGQQYLTAMVKNIEDCVVVLKTSKAAQSAGIISYLAMVGYAITCTIERSSRPPNTHYHPTLAAVYVCSYWGTVHFLLPVAAYHRNLTEPVNIWEPNDPIDKLFYQTPPTEAPIRSEPPLDTVPPTNADRSVGQTLSDCTESLAEASDEIAKLTRFFGAISCLAQHIVHSHIRSFTDAVSAVIKNQSEAPTKKQQQELEKAARVVQASCALIQAIANMYVEINEDYVHKGWRLLGLLGKSDRLGGMKYKSRMLQDYVADVEARLAGAMKEQKEKLFREAEKNLCGLAGAMG